MNSFVLVGEERVECLGDTLIRARCVSMAFFCFTTRCLCCVMPQDSHVEWHITSAVWYLYSIISLICAVLRIPVEVFCVNVFELKLKEDVCAAP